MTPIIKDPVVPNMPKIPAENPANKPQENPAHFDAHLQGPENSAAQAANNPPAQGIDPTKTGPSGQVGVSGANLPKQDFLGQFEHLRKDFQAFVKKSGDLDALVADGKLKPDDPKVKKMRQEEMRTLLHFQVEMQGAAMRVEIASKVVEQATSGVKNVLSTQA